MFCKSVLSYRNANEKIFANNFEVKTCQKNPPILAPNYNFLIPLSVQPEMEFKEFEPRFKSAKTRFKLSARLNLKTFDTILSEINHI